MLAQIIDSAATGADVLSSKSDRWLFLCCLIVMAIIAVAVVRWLVGKFEASQAQLTATLEKVIGEQKLMMGQMGEIIRENTETYKGVKQLLEEIYHGDAPSRP
jgi:flagellar basal body-associated protein FliL